MRANAPPGKPLPPFAAWSPATAPPPSPRGGEIHLWHVNLAQAASQECLSGDERCRAARLSGTARRRFIATRAALRGILGGYLGLSPAQLRFTYNPNGKPRLEPPGPAFNLAHSGDHALIAIGAGAAIGVDIELPRPRIRIDALAARVLSAEDQAALAALTGEARRWEFLRRWTLFEAVVKLHGHGLFQTVAKASAARSTLSLRFGDEAIGALASDRDEILVPRCWRWR